MKTKLHKLLCRNCLIGSVIAVSCGGLIALKPNDLIQGSDQLWLNDTENQESEIDPENNSLQYLLIENGTVKGFKVGVNIPNDFVLVIPAQNGSNRISRIGHRAFENRTEIKGVLIGQGIQQIREQAFSNCTNLEIILLPDSIVKIESNAFSHCHNLTSITIPENVNFIGSRVLYDCPNLNSQSVVNRSSVLFDWWVDNHYYHDQTLAQMEIINLDDYRNSINQPFQIIGEGVLSNLKDLQSLTIPYSISEIGRFAFSECPRLTSNNITNYSGVLFRLWVNQHRENNQSLGEMKTINLANHFNSEHRLFNKIGDDAFLGNKNLENIAIPNTIIKIGERAFDSGKLKRITLPRSIEEIKPHAFQRCDLLNSANFVNNSPVLFDWWVNNHYYSDQTLQKMKEIDLGCFTNSENEPFRIIAQNALGECEDLQKIIIRENIYKINAHVFGLANSTLKTIIIDTDDLIVDLDAFEGVSPFAQYYVNNQAMGDKLRGLGINDNQINVADNDWYIKKYNDQCELVNLTPKGIRSEHLTIPANVTKLDPQVFSTHQGLLKTITIESNQIKLENNFVSSIPDDLVFHVSNSAIKNELIKLGVNKKNIKVKHNWHIGKTIAIIVGVIAITSLVVGLVVLFWRRYQYHRIGY